VIRNLFILFLLVILLQSEQFILLLSNISSNAIVLILNAIGYQVVFSENTFILGNISIPWSVDCSGINTFVILLGVVLWKKYRPGQLINNVILLLLIIPAALMANIFRALAIIAYRYYFYPEVESPELHFLIGFLLLIPFIYLFVSNRKSLSINDWTLITYFSVIFSLLAPLYYAPGGIIILLATLSCLYFNFNLRQPFNSQWQHYLFWIIAALFITSSKMESLWLPWLLLWPSIVSSELIKKPVNLIILSGTIQPLAMHEFWQAMVVTMILYQVIRLYVFKVKTEQKATKINKRNKLATAVLSCFVLTIPVMSPSFGNELQNRDYLPKGLMNNTVDHNTFKLRLIGQPNDLDIYLFKSSNNDRHHALVSCMRFKGVTLHENKSTNGVYESEQRYMREFFIIDGKIIDSYHEYIIATLLPFSNSGEHVIFDAPKNMFNAEYFNQQAIRYMTELVKK
jgi:exosortase/archaeosortase family protein